MIHALCEHASMPFRVRATMRRETTNLLSRLVNFSFQGLLIAYDRSKDTFPDNRPSTSSHSSATPARPSWCPLGEAVFFATTCSPSTHPPLSLSGRDAFLMSFALCVPSYSRLPDGLSSRRIPHVPLTFLPRFGRAFCCQLHQIFHCARHTALSLLKITCWRD
jgi:hypothetical protein